MEKVIDKATKNPTPEERPDLYDSYDGSGRPVFGRTGVGVSDRLEKLVAERAAKKPAQDVAAE